MPPFFEPAHIVMADGRWLDGADSIDVANPATGELLV